MADGGYLIPPQLMWEMTYPNVRARPLRVLMRAANYNLADANKLDERGLLNVRGIGKAYARELLAARRSSPFAPLGG